MNEKDFDIRNFLLFQDPASPQDVIDQASPYDGLADSPPAISGYRDANVLGMACWNCAHFTAVDDNDNDGVIDGICNLWEARADGESTCDRFTAHADLFRQSPHTSWAEEMSNDMQDRINSGDSMGPSVAEVNYSDNAVLNEIHFAGEGAQEEEGLIWKDILRTGKWNRTPTRGGVVKKTLQIVRDGATDPDNGILSLSEIYNNFNEDAVPYVTVPLSDDTEDHKNIARLNTGFVRKLKLVDRDGRTFLRAGIDFTEPDVKGKVLRGTIPDVSAGVPYGVRRRSDDREFGAVLDHVCLTRKPFVDKLAPFGLAAADGEELPIEDWEREESEDATLPPRETPPNTSESEEGNISLSHRDVERAIRSALSDQLHLSAEYQVDDVYGTRAVISHRTSGASWNVPFSITKNSDNPVTLENVASWQLIEEENENSSNENQNENQIAASDNKPLNDLQRARELRELRLAHPTSKGGIQMSDLTLDGAELSDEARARIQSILSENEDLKKRNRESEVNERIEELKNLGLSDRPGALKLYRQIMLSDDDGPAIVLFSDNADDDKKERLTAIQILDRFIDAMKAEGSVVFSDQALASGNDKKPPTNADGETKPLEERAEEARQALYGKRSRRK